MNLVRKVLARNRIRGARRRLTREPSPRNYAALAQEYALLGSTIDVVKVCEEGLNVFPGSAELARLRERATRLEREERMAQLKRELAEAPRPALWLEMCNMLLESGRLARAEETARDWLSSGGGEEARLTLGRVQIERYLADRGRQLGLKAHETLSEAMAALPGDPRPLRMMMRFAGKVGAWKEAHRCAGELLRLAPGDPVLEARFRKLGTLADKASSVDHALIDIERTGRLADEGDENIHSHGPGTDVRPLLRELSEQSDVQAALYIRGATVLVQGPKGATAERTAKSVRNVLASGRSASRRMGLGNVSHIQLEGEFGTLAVAPGDLDAGAVWVNGHMSRAREDSLASLAGANADVSEVDA